MQPKITGGGEEEAEERKEFFFFTLSAIEKLLLFGQLAALLPMANKLANPAII